MDEHLTELLTEFNAFFWNFGFAFLLIGAGLWFTLRTRFVQVSLLGDLVRILGRRTRAAADGLTPFEAFCVSTGARVGVGNIAGIALAVTTGGPGAVFWMWVTALIGAASGFAESTLAQLYKERAADGSGYAGGPAAYIAKGVGSVFWAGAFAVLLALSDGLIFNSVLSNTMAIALETTTGAPRWLGGILLALYALWVVRAGAKRLAGFASRIVPFMVIAYLALAAGMTVLYVERVPDVIRLIFESAFTPEAATGAGLWFVIMTGVRRGLYSHEAGQGTVPNAAAAAECAHPVEQGLVQAAGVYVDTLLVCTATAMIVLLPEGTAASGLTGIELVTHILTDAFGPAGGWAVFLLALAFALTSVIGNFFYSEMSLRVVTKSRLLLFVFRSAVVGMVFLGAQMSLGLVWNLADLFMGLMVLVNVTALLKLSRVVTTLLADYRTQRAQTEEPAFSKTRIPEAMRRGVSLWD